MSDPNAYPSSAPKSSVATAVMGGAIAALLVAVVYLFVQVHDLKADAVKRSDAIAAQIDTLKENTAMVASTSRKHMDTMHDELESKSARQAAMAANLAKSEALARIEQSKKQLEDEQLATATKINGDLTAVKTSAETANAKIADVSGDVSNVKTQVASTRSELDKTIGDLKKVTGDLGVTSDYVATNGKELAALKRLGERDYTEFTLSKNKAGQRVGDVMLTLKKVDQKRNRFTLEVFADDKRTEKKDRTVNEPVQFYVAKARQPYEIVVNEVKKDVIVGYLAKPKDRIARN